MVGFLGNLFQTALDLPHEKELGIERAHQVLAPKPSGLQAKPQSIMVKFRSYRTKEEASKAPVYNGQVWELPDEGRGPRESTAEKRGVL